MLPHFYPNISFAYCRQTKQRKFPRNQTHVNFFNQNFRTNYQICTLPSSPHKTIYSNLDNTDISPHRIGDLSPTGFVLCALPPSGASLDARDKVTAIRGRSLNSHFTYKNQTVKSHTGCHVAGETSN